VFVFCLAFERGTRKQAKTNFRTKPNKKPSTRFFSRPPLLLSFLLACWLAFFVSLFLPTAGRQAGFFVLLFVCVFFFGGGGGDGGRGEE
jgi:hypothetical protein